MLVLTRQKDGVIVIGNNEIRITIVDVRGDKVRLGFEAEKEIPIHREEIYNLIQEQENDSRD